MSVSAFIETIGFEQTLLQQRQLLSKVILFLIVYTADYYFFNAFSAGRLASGSSLYQLLSNFLHRHWLYSIQEPTMHDEANTLYFRLSLLIIPVWELNREI